MAVPDVKEGKLDAERRKALNLAITQIEKQLGKGSIMRMGTDAPRERVVAISTGAINLDAATGVGGIPRGRITEIYGPESSGKTTLTLHLAANVQRAGGVAAYVDAEHALDIEYAKKLGVDVDNLLVCRKSRPAAAHATQVPERASYSCKVKGRTAAGTRLALSTSLKSIRGGRPWTCRCNSSAR